MSPSDGRRDRRFAGNLEPGSGPGGGVDAKDLLTIGEMVDRSGFPHSALRYYEREGLISSSRTSGPSS